MHVKPGDLVRRLVGPRPTEQLIFCLYELGEVGQLKRNRNVVTRFFRDDLLLVISVTNPVEILLMTPKGTMGWDQNDHSWEIVCG